MDYQECCLQNFQQNPSFLRCPQCGTLLIRCKSCSLLCDEAGFCPVCIHPRFLWRLPSPLKAKEMGAVELVVENHGKRPFGVREIRYGLTGMERLREKEANEFLQPSKGQIFYLDGLLPSRGGQYGLHLEVVLYWPQEHWGYLEEEIFVYEGETLVSVEAPKDQGIHISGVGENARILISNPSYDVKTSSLAVSAYQKIILKRSFSTEAKFASYSQGYRASRKTRLLFPHLQTGEPKEYHFLFRNRLGFGRAKVKEHERVDHTLRIYPLEGKGREMTLTISAHHFDLVLMGGKLFVVDLSSYGTTLNRKPLPKGVPVPIQNGDLLSPFMFGEYIPHLTFQARFSSQGGQLKQVEFRKI